MERKRQACHPVVSLERLALAPLGRRFRKESQSAMTTTEERLSRLEGAYEHVATKADVTEVRVEIAETRTELKTDIANLDAKISNMETRLIRWIVGSIAAATSIVLLVQRLLS